jgi:signal transduction histidine kinase
MSEVGEQLVQHLKSAFAGNQERFKLQCDGRHYRVCVVPIQPENGAITHAITVFENITEQIRQQRELERQNEQLDEFAQVVSHDLQSPLTVAQNSLELAQEPHNGEHLSRASDALARSQALVDDLLALAKQGKEAIEYESIALEEFAQQVWHTAETGPAVIKVDAAQPIHADRSQLRQLLENLYLNAIEHGGSDVTVSVGTTDDGFYIADTGPGITESNRTEVFEPGYSTSDDGTGFGLRIVERIVEMHGWEITVTESEENGARFDITGVEFSE